MQTVDEKVAKHRISRWMKVILILGGLFVLLVLSVVSFYLVTNITGHKAWELYVKESDGWIDSTSSDDFAIPRARTRNYIWMKDLVPPPVDDQKNFAEHPLWVEIFRPWPVVPLDECGNVDEKVDYDKEAVAVAERLHQERLKGWIPMQEGTINEAEANYLISEAVNLEEGKRLNLQERLAKGYLNEKIGAPPETEKTAAENILPLLAEGEVAQQKIQKILRDRPLCRYPVRWIISSLKDYIPSERTLHYFYIKDFCKFAAIHAYVHLTLGNKEAVMSDLLYCAALADTLSREPSSVSMLVKESVYTKYVLNILWESLERDFWTEAELKQLQDRLAKVDYWDDLQLGLMGDRAFINQMAKKDIRFLDREIAFYDDGIMKYFYLLKPVGWCYRELLNYNGMTDSLLASMDNEDKRFKPREMSETLETLNAYFLGERLSYDSFIFNFAGAEEIMICKVVYQQFLINAAQVSCALERYRIANGRYPSSLDTLRDILPEEEIRHDWVTFLKPKIKLTEGGYILWSNGWNRKDDGGKRNTEKRDIHKLQQGDWVWEIKR